MKNTLQWPYASMTAAPETIALYNVVKLTTCSTDDADKWVNYYNPNTKRTEFISFWSEVDDWYQQWVS